MTFIKKITIPYKEPNNLSELMIQISARPAMFVGWSDFTMAVSFIEGYVYARNQLGKPKEVKMLKDFSVWLAKKLERPKNWAWSGIIKDCYKDDEIALENLPKLFNEFLSQSSEN
jgi:hypothetical protein